jgi:phosphoribosylformylglycinamidine cyclo-ligase
MKDKGKRPLTYSEAGVDIQTGDEAVRRIRRLAGKTFTKEVLSDIGSFGGFFKPNLEGIKEPVLISSADGVGTKLKLAFMTNRHNTVGEDLVNHCVDDILVHGARPLFFLDYIATGKLHPEVIAEIVEGFSRGCLNAGMALLGGETAELPDFYQPGEYDLAGFIVGIADRGKIITGETIAVGDVCIGLASDGLHTNGYTLARKVAFDLAGLQPGDHIEELGTTIGEALMKVHRCYASPVLAVASEFDIHGMAHITGGGLTGNLSRVLPGSVDARIDTARLPVPPIFTYLQRTGNIATGEMFRVFNMGVGFVLVVKADEAADILARLRRLGETADVIGEIVAGAGRVELG